MAHDELATYIAVDQGVRFGKPCIAGIRFAPPWHLPQAVSWLTLELMDKPKSKFYSAIGDTSTILGVGRFFYLRVCFHYKTRSSA